MSSSEVKAFGSILATDLDGTLVGHDQGYDDLINYLKKMRETVGLVYVTGRHYHSALELIETKELEKPDFLITDVGTVIRIFGCPSPDHEWEKRMRANWQPAAIRKIGKTIHGLTEQDLPDDCRISYFADSDAAAEKFEQKLQDAAIPHQYIYSSGRDVDILPAGSGKGEAIKYIFRKFSRFGARILVAGDSGNDREMIEAGYPAVIVSNAQPELKAIPESSLIYHASTPCALGILEAWKHFFENNGSGRGL